MLIFEGQSYPRCKFTWDVQLHYLGIKANRESAKPYGDNNKQYFSFYTAIVRVSGTMLTCPLRPRQCLEIWESEEEHQWKHKLLPQSWHSPGTQHSFVLILASRIKHAKTAYIHLHLWMDTNYCPVATVNKNHFFHSCCRRLLETFYFHVSCHILN